ncbi:MAG: hypothetical protein E6G04_13005 [Actinobacteria bacterium]|nr:MAG: hypothetical protein E6G04_13005 [Actinomycetota bacterium]
MKEITRDETRGSYLLWYGVLAGPIVWSMQLLLDYGLDEAVVCAPGNRTRGVFFNTSIGVVIQIVNAVATVLTVLAFAVSYRCYRRLRGGDSTTGNRARWMAIAGMFDSALFLMLVVMKFVPALFFHSCEGF